MPVVLISSNRESCTLHATYTYPSIDVWPCSPIFVPRDPGRGGRDGLAKHGQDLSDDLRGVAEDVAREVDRA